MMTGSGASSPSSVTTSFVLMVSQCALAASLIGPSSVIVHSVPISRVLRKLSLSSARISWPTSLSQLLA